MAMAKLTPRQRMINLMYLVFLALMALNVSVEVLDSFPLINKGIEQTNINLDQKIQTVMNDFEMQEVISAEKVQPFYDEAKEVRQLSNELIEYISKSRSSMIAKLNKITIEEAAELSLLDLEKKDNYSVSSKFWLQDNNLDPMQPGGRGTRAYELHEKLLEFRTTLQDILEKHKLQETVKLGIDLEGPYYLPNSSVEIKWQQHMFDRVIPVAVATNLTRLVTEIRNAEFDVINTLFGAISADDFKFDKIAARVVPNSQIVLAGDSYEADIFVAAYDSKQEPEILVNGQRIPAEGGVGRIRIPASGTGARSFSGIIKVTNPYGIPQEYPFESSFMVQQPSVTVSADKMNLFYIGLDNPVSISVPGVPTENIRPSISAGATLTPRGGTGYTVRVSPGTNEVRINVNAVIEGSSRNMGTQVFRVRNVPDPVAYIANRREGRISREELALARAIIPRLDNFEFDMNFEIASFTMSTLVSGDFRTFSTSGNRFSDEMLQIINNALRGQRIIFENITTRPGPDARTRTLSPISFIIN